MKTSSAEIQEKFSALTQDSVEHLWQTIMFLRSQIAEKEDEIKRLKAYLNTIPKQDPFKEVWRQIP